MKNIIDLKSIIIGVLGTTLVFVSMAATNQKGYPENIVAKSFVLVNDSGDSLAVIGQKFDNQPMFYLLNKGKVTTVLGNDGTGNGFFEIYNKNQTLAIGTGVTENYGWLATYNDGKVTTGLGTDETGSGTIEVYNKDGKVTAGVINGWILTLNNDGKVTTGLGTDETGSGTIEVYNKDENLAIRLSVGNHGGGIQTLNKDMNVATSLHVAENGGGTVYTYYKDGKTQASMYGPSFQVYNNNGNQISYMGLDVKGSGMIELQDINGSSYYNLNSINKK